MLAGNVVSAAHPSGAVAIADRDDPRQMLALEQQQLEITEKRYQAGGVSEYDVHSQRTARGADAGHASAAGAAARRHRSSTRRADGARLRPSAHVRASRLDSLHLPERAAVEPAFFTGTAASGHSRRGVLAASGQRQCGRGYGESVSADRAVGERWGSSARASPAAATSGTWARRWPSPSSTAEHCGRRSARRVAAYDEAGSVYRQTVLKRFAKWRTALRAIEHDAQTLQARTEAAATGARQHIRLQRSAMAPAASARSRLLDAQRQQLQTALDRVDYPPPAGTPTPPPLLQALGGGWWNEKPAGATANQKTQP